jgi:cysteinyl-tRNA synthetase
MYVCGVTVYDVCHIGHARNAVVFDVIYRYLQYRGHDVAYVRNFTDVDDKIITRAQHEHTTTEEIAARYINEFTDDMDTLGLKRPTVEPRATDHIPDMITMIQRLIDKGHAYVIEGDVFFSVESFSEYGKLSNRTLEEMQAGARIGVNDRKRNPLDFALWKAAKPGEPAWESPWGQGRPGWHIECSTMSQRYLGDTFDIHGGGKDLIFPHHENEIAQAEGTTDQTFARYWLHNGFITVNREKMSKSLGNFLTIRDVLTRYHPEVLRFFLLSRHYRSPIDYSEDEMEVARRHMERFYETLAGIERAVAREEDRQEIVEGFSPGEMAVYRTAEGFSAAFQAAMDDDFNTASALAVLFELTPGLNRILQHPSANRAQILRKGREAFDELGSVLGLFQEDPREFLEIGRNKKLQRLSLAPNTIEHLIDERSRARKEKNWAKADEIRDRLARDGIALHDGPDGTSWTIQ